MSVQCYYDLTFTGKVRERLTWFVNKIPEDRRSELYEDLEESVPRTRKVGIAELKESCTKLAIPFSETMSRRWTLVVCDACEQEYRYFPCPSEEEKLEDDIFDRCPRCGFDYDFQRTFLAHSAWGAVDEKYAAEYERRRMLCLEKYGEGKPWRFNKAELHKQIREEEAAELAAQRKKIEDQLKRKTFFSARDVEKLELQAEYV